MKLTKSLYKKFGLGLAVVMGSAMMLGACGDNTATPVPAATTNLS
ncbi:hypothetical protein [Candidatus Chlorohelix sp.]